MNNNNNNKEKLMLDVTTIMNNSFAFRKLQEDLRNKRSYACIGTVESVMPYIDIRAREVDVLLMATAAEEKENKENDNKKTINRKMLDMK